MQTLPLQPFHFGEFEGKRRVASFGFRYDYDLRQLRRAEPIPGWLAELVANVETFGGPGVRIQQILCTEYGVGVGIGFTDAIYVAVEGKAELNRDKAVFNWTSDLDRWFDKGVDTPNIVLIKIKANRITYWDGEEEGEIRV
ncbi:pyridoxamine 5'-phosphate oxidase family protein [Bradyrhizobium sp. AUGA SZCCT0042]|nr:pyridoxamine 5'-phosphate oxidase family protein [Bradyrhizobium sp. AUGA SZCCT0042]